MHVCFADERSRNYIESMDAEKDLAILAQHGLGIRPECARVLRVLTSLLKKAAARCMTPFDIGCIMCRCAQILKCKTTRRASCAGAS